VYIRLKRLVGFARLSCGRPTCVGLGWLSLSCASSTPVQELTSPPIPSAADFKQCESAQDCPTPKDQCLGAYCRQGRCVESEAPEGTRCGLSEKYALMQGNRYWPERNNPGVCVRRECIPRALCMRECGRGVGETINAGPPVQLNRCRDRPKCDHDETLLQVGAEHILGCAIACGFDVPSIDVRGEATESDNTVAPSSSETAEQ
jgi:hypothetical protein